MLVVLGRQWVQVGEVVAASAHFDAADQHLWSLHLSAACQHRNTKRNSSRNKKIVRFKTQCQVLLTCSLKTMVDWNAILVGSGLHAVVLARRRRRQTSITVAKLDLNRLIRRVWSELLP